MGDDDPHDLPWKILNISAEHGDVPTVSPYQSIIDPASVRSKHLTKSPPIEPLHSKYKNIY